MSYLLRQILKNGCEIFCGIIQHSFSRYKINYWSAVFGFRKFLNCSQINNTLHNKSAQLMSITKHQIPLCTCM